MKRAFYSASISEFLVSPHDEILGTLSSNNQFNLETTQRNAWQQQISILKQSLLHYQGQILFEYEIPRMGRRIDVVLIIKNVLFVLEFKVGDIDYYRNALEQVWDYALDLKNFHETSHKVFIAPILIATLAPSKTAVISEGGHTDQILLPIKANSKTLSETLVQVLEFVNGEVIDSISWQNGRYQPTPTIIEAAKALYNNHSVADISRSDAGAINLNLTNESISKIIEDSKANNKKGNLFRNRCAWSWQNISRT